MLARLLAAFCLIAGGASADVYRIYLDADRSTNFASARSIEIGIRAAFDEVGHEIGGRRIELVPLDHRANVRRSKAHLEQFLADPQAIAVIGGQQSLPYLAAQDFVNDNTIPLLLPWSAAVPLTRPKAGENTIFRLSLDDSKAASVIIPHAVEEVSCQRITLLLWESGWGRSNEVTMRAELEQRGFHSYEVVYFTGNLSTADVQSVASQVALFDSDCAIYVGSARDAAAIFTVLKEADLSLTVLSHWGITGGDFENLVADEIRRALALQFIQPCFDFSGRHDAAGARLNRIFQAYPNDFDSSGYLKAPAGFFHGFDLGVLLIAALQEVDPNTVPMAARGDLVAALENLSAPQEGLLRRYEAPFRKFDGSDPDAHEALALEDFCMARFDHNDRIVPAGAGGS